MVSLNIFSEETGIQSPFLLLIALLTFLLSTVKFLYILNINHYQVLQNSIIMALFHFHYVSSKSNKILILT